MPPAAFSSSLAAGVELQLAVLRQLPTPVVVMSHHAAVVLANRAAEKLLTTSDLKYPLRANVLGYSLADLGIEVAGGKPWANVLRELQNAHDRFEQAGVEQEQDVECLKISIMRTHIDGKLQLNATLSVLEVDNEQLFVLSIERACTKTTSNGVEAYPMPSSSSKRLKLQTEHRKSIVAIPFVDEDSGGRLLKMRTAIFDSLETAGFLITADEKFYLTNKKMRQLLGNIMGDEAGCHGEALREKLEIWNASFTERINPVDFPGVRLVRDKQPLTNYVCGFTYESGAKFATRVTGECLYDDENGELLGGVCWCRDLQEYSQFLRDEQERLLLSHETICDLMPHMVWTTRPDGYVDWYSKRWYDFTGMLPEQCIGYGYQQAMHQDDLPFLMQKWSSGMAAGEECSAEVRYRRKDGIYRWMLARASPYRDSQGNVLKWYGTNTDIHDLVMARIEASKNTQQILSVLAQGEINLFAIDNDFKITMAEGAMYGQINGNGVEKATFLGQTVFRASQDVPEEGISGMSSNSGQEHELIGPDFEKNIRDILAGKETMAVSENTIEGRIYRTTVVVDLVHDSTDGNQRPAIRGVLGLSIDVTDMKARVALELQNARLTIQEQSAQEASKLKSQFLANMSHEMRTPTAGVIGMVELLGDDPTLTEEQREYVNSISLSAKALLTIVNDILDFSKIESGRLDIEEVPFNLSVVVGELCKILGVFANQKGLKFVYENTLGDRLNEQEYMGDPGRIRQILSNLLTNALKFTQNGSVTLSISSTESDGVLDLKFVVRDTGIGIDKTTLDKLFRPFCQGDASTARLYGGTGLGLTISRNLASLMNGSIELTSIPTKGSTATFQVPLKLSTGTLSNRALNSSPPNPGFRIYRTPPTRVEALKSPIKQSRSYQSSLPPKYNGPRLERTHSFDSTISQLSLEDRSQIHVLVVEDNAVNQTIALKTIRKLGFPVTATWNGQEALSYLRSPSPTQPRPSIILMDVQMPIMDGYEATRILRNHSLDTEDVVAPKQQVDGTVGTTIASLADIPVIAMTASAIQGDEEKCYAAGMDDYLSKPVEKVRLEAMLVKWAGRKRL
ncbi:hypothetical protein BP5796_07113 [Coleophoma crateriformis]|uniref:histidine kinase n=1 Tax=Coleophoma crateriformis TaxID=565419 RepID=A0A3D8RIJ8_9HELO|nr:hypothetical protein BP5796_07113 [Coleophoma crateriformis]